MSRRDTFACASAAVFGCASPLVMMLAEPPHVARLATFAVRSVSSVTIRSPPVPALEPLREELPGDPDVSPAGSGPPRVYFEPDDTRVVELRGFPAVSPDGGLVAVAVPCSGPMCGALRVEIRFAASDAVVEELPLTDGYSASGSLLPPAEVVRTRAAHIEKRVGLWTPMGPAMWQAPGGDKTSVRVDDAMLTVQYEPPSLSLSRAERRIWRRDAASWRAPRSSERACPAFAGGMAHEISQVQAWIDASHEIVALEVSYAGNDSCWEPSPTWHAVRIR